MAGVAPVQASSGNQERQRLSRAGNRELNSALYMIVVSLAYDPRSRRYLARRTAERKTRREAIRCLTRYLARELFPNVRDAITGLDNP